MTITAKVHDRSIALPPEVQVEDGTEVQITVPDGRLLPAVGAEVQPGVAAAIRRHGDHGVEHDAIMQMTRGEG